MESLHTEIVEYILMNPSLSITDVINFSFTCRRFREIVNSNRSLWKIKYFQRWPKTDFDVECEDWYNECISRRHFEKQVLELLSSMSSKFFNVDIKNTPRLQLDFAYSLINSHKYGYYYLRDFLISINSLPLTQSLTNKYYGNMLLKYVHKNQCREIWNDLIQLNTKEQTLEKGAIFVSLWCQENERGIWKTVSSELDAIATRIKEQLLQSFMDHPLKNVPEEVELAWRNENIPGNMFQPQDCKSVIHAINFVLFKEYKYCVTYDFNDLDNKQYGIYYALLDRRANPIIFSIIYESIARRLGVKIEVLVFLDHCLLRWKEDYSVKDSPIHYINTSAENIFTTSRCPRRNPGNTVMPACNMQQAAQMAALSVCPREREDNYFSVWDTLELVLVVNPLSLECYQRLYRFCVLHKIDAKEFINKLNLIENQISDVEWQSHLEIFHMFRNYQIRWERKRVAEPQEGLVVHNRVEGMKFAVGMIVRIELSGQMGVICGWKLSDWTPMECNSRTVYYALLVDDGNYMFIPQACLRILHSPPFFSHPSLGRYFDEYCLTYYKPNKELQARYPQEMEALQTILKLDRQN